MIRYNLFFITTFLTLFTGCGTNTALNYFQNDKESANAIQYTKKIDLDYKNEPKLMLFVTYLNKSRKKFDTKELNSFVIGTYFIGQDNHDFIEKDFKLFLNNKSFLNIKKLSKKSELRSDIPLKNSWARYYLVNFKNEKKIKDLNIKLIHPTFGQVILKFQK
jgi:hypothetical protein